MISEGRSGVDDVYKFQDGMSPRSRWTEFGDVE